MLMGPIEKRLMQEVIVGTRPGCSLVILVPLSVFQAYEAELGDRAMYSRGGLTCRTAIVKWIAEFEL